MAQTDLALLSDRAGDGEGLEALADGSCTVGSALQAALNGNGGAQGVCPDSIVEADGLDAADDLKAAMKPERYTGRAKEQVDEFLAEVIQPILDANKEDLGVKAEINV